jgi:hypothetical protein
MLRTTALAVLLTLALTAAAQANPSITVTSARVGSTAKLPAAVRHTLQLTAGATSEALTVSVTPAAHITVSGVATSPPVAQTGPSVAACPGRWTRFHVGHPAGPYPTDVSFTIPPGQTATLTADVQFVTAPWPDETLDATWSIEPATGQDFDVVSNAPLYSGPLGVKLDFQVTRTAELAFVVTGTASPDVSSGRVELWAYAPKAKKAKRVARVALQDGEWSTRFTPTKGGLWELYARYRTARKSFANDSSECGTIVPVTIRG